MAAPNRYAEVRDPLYKIRFHLYHAPEARLVARCKRDGEVVEAHNGAGRCLFYQAPGFGQLVVHLWFSPNTDLRTPFGVSCVAHEAVHAANAVFEHVGCAPTFAWHADEPYAYYVEWIVRETIRRLGGR